MSNANRAIKTDLKEFGQKTEKEISVDKNTLFYLKSACSGSLAACLTHFIMVPMDVIKTRIQLSPTSYPNTKAAFRAILAKEGAKGLTLGLGATNFGYLTQGFFKYGLYELFKTKFPNIIGQERAERNASLLYLIAGMSAEAVADVFLTPFEAIRIRLVSDPKYAHGTFNGIVKIVKTEKISGLYRGFTPLLMKQVPYTAVKFTVFEAMEELFYDHLITTPRCELSNLHQLCVTAASGFVGGVASAVASHPADTMLTKVNTSNNSMWQALRSAGWKGTWAGLMPRMGMVGTLAALQLLAYDSAKVAIFGLPTSQGIKTGKSTS